MTNFQMILEETRTLVKENLAHRDRCPSYMSDKQLMFILDELDKMERAENIHLKNAVKQDRDIRCFSAPVSQRIRCFTCLTAFILSVKSLCRP